MKGGSEVWLGNHSIVIMKKESHAINMNLRKSRTLCLDFNSCLYSVFVWFSGWTDYSCPLLTIFHFLKHSLCSVSLLYFLSISALHLFITYSEVFNVYSHVSFYILRFQNIFSGSQSICKLCELLTIACAWSLLAVIGFQPLKDGNALLEACFC